MANEEQVLVEKVNKLTSKLRQLTHKGYPYTWDEAYERAMIHRERLVYYRELWKMGWSMSGWALPSDNIEQ